MRRGGRLVEAGWEEALDAAAEGLAGVVRRHGLDALAIYLGNPMVHALGALLGAEMLRRLLPTRNSYTANSQDANPLTGNAALSGVPVEVRPAPAPEAACPAAAAAAAGDSAT